MKQGRLNSLNLFLLKYWNLYDSLFYSAYTIPKLKTWHESGKNDLKKFIAQLGIPLEEAKQKFDFLGANHKEHLKERVCEADDGRKYADALMMTFTYHLDSKHQYSALDFCTIIASVLNNHRNFNDIVLKLDREDEDMFGSNKEDNFWCAYHKLLERLIH